MTNIPKVLYRVNRHGNNVSILNYDIQTKHTLKVISNQLEEILKYKVSEELIILYTKLCYANFDLDFKQINQIGYLIKDLANNSTSLNLNNPETFVIYLTKKWEHLCYNNLVKNKNINKIWKQFSPIKPSFKLRVKFLIKELIQKINSLFYKKHNSNH